MRTDAKAVVRLSIDERQMLEKRLQEPRMAKDRGLRNNVLLKSDADGPKWPDSKIAEAFESAPTQWLGCGSGACLRDWRRPRHDGVPR